MELFGSVISLALMSVELLSAEMIFGLLLERRKQFAARVVLSFLVCFAVIILVELIYYQATGNIFSYSGATTFWDSVFKFFLYCLIFVLTVVGCCFCFKNSIWTILFYCAGGFAAQHLSVNAAMLLKLIPGYTQFIKDLPWFHYCLEPGVCAAVYSAIYFLLVRNKKVPQNIRRIRNRVLFSLLIIVICIGISRITADDSSRGVTAFLAETLSAVINCFLILMLHFNLTENDEMHYEVNILEELLHREKEQFRLSKENIELINIKCHDLKHQIKALRADASEKQLTELENSVMIYDSEVKTGNDVLDIILTEKSLYCLNNKIRLQCMANGNELSFMDSMDIYSLFGNALSNAIESVSGISEEKRLISVNIQPLGNMLTIHVDNYYEGEIRFENGLPVTSADERYHGFGMKSMNYIVNKYGGHMSVSAEKGVFALDIIFPVKR